MSKLLLAFAILASTAAVQADMVFFDRNSSLSPVNDVFTGVEEVGFAFTPTDTVDLSGFRTKFFSSDGRMASFQVFNSVGGVPDTAVTLLSESFTTIGGGVLHGVDFSPLTLIGGMQYFVALTNVNGLGFNVTGDAGAQQVPLGEVRFTATGDPLRFQNPNSTPPNTQPIVQLLTPAPLPEPSTTVLLALCGAVGGGVSWRRRRAARG
jgi:hypothetical protein